MNSKRWSFVVGGILVVLLGVLGSEVEAKGDSPKSKDNVKCHMTFDLKGWSAFYKTMHGSGNITCDNGQSAAVKIKTYEGGVTFGKSRIIDGKGSFSMVGDIKELYGSYASSGAHAGAVGSAAAQAMTKGDVSLALSGTGKGFDLGIAFGRFKIIPR